MHVPTCSHIYSASIVSLVYLNWIVEMPLKFFYDTPQQIRLAKARSTAKEGRPKGSKSRETKQKKQTNNFKETEIDRGDQWSYLLIKVTLLTVQVIRDNCRSLQQYDWLKLVVAWLKPELGNCNFLLRNKLNNYVRGGGWEGRRGWGMVNTEMGSYNRRSNYLPWSSLGSHDQSRQ